jgi:hypothetical protein
LRRSDGASGRGIAGAAPAIVIIVIVIVIVVAVVVIVTATRTFPAAVIIVVVIVACENERHRLRGVVEESGDGPKNAIGRGLHRAPGGDADRGGQRRGRDQKCQGLFHGRVSFRLLKPIWRPDLRAS